MPTNEMPSPDDLRDHLVAELAVLLVTIDLARQAEQHDSAPLSELACLVAAMHAQLYATDPRFIRRAWDFVSALRDLHRAHDRRHASLAGYLRARGESLGALIAPANLLVGPDGSVSCESLAGLTGGEVH